MRNKKPSPNVPHAVNVFKEITKYSITWPKSLSNKIMTNTVLLKTLLLNTLLRYNNKENNIGHWFIGLILPDS